ncbi:MAG: RnfABCDGE type electron transport complex subunit D [Candidatus Methanoliparum thermophilum]|uniref:Ion-translocating oxidoreductase complex subunit D n=1 Tax=Methanoliparum thermophilum TaxID=2491083 RepID=A0A520KU19_METT2|nr:MAG: RnfABCDGE type electron transport complex subunit D [Candidatus Methanoliparum thermophilum]
MILDKKNIKMTPSPHLKKDISVKRIMFLVILALMPTTIAGIYFFGYHALLVIILSILSAEIAEFLSLKIQKKKFVMDGSAIITGLLLALVLPPTVPFWVPVVGSFFAIAIAKHAFGGLGQNLFNPALVGRAFLMICWPVLMTRWVTPFDAVTTATPLAALKMQNLVIASNIDLFFGGIGGCIGETSALAILIGGIILIALKVIDWRTPLSIICTVFVLMLLLGQDPIFHILAGGLMLGAFFMATDYVTTPITGWGRVIFGMGVGLLIVVFRLWSGMPEGVCYSILIMNGFTPLIDRYIRPLPLGIKKTKVNER